MLENLSKANPKPVFAASDVQLSGGETSHLSGGETSHLSGGSKSDCHLASGDISGVEKSDVDLSSGNKPDGDLSMKSDLELSGGDMYSSFRSDVEGSDDDKLSAKVGGESMGEYESSSSAEWNFVKKTAPGGDSVEELPPQIPPKRSRTPPEVPTRKGSAKINLPPVSTSLVSHHHNIYVTSPIKQSGESQSVIHSYTLENPANNLLNGNLADGNQSNFSTITNYNTAFKNKNFSSAIFGSHKTSGGSVTVVSGITDTTTGGSLTMVGADSSGGSVTMVKTSGGTTAGSLTVVDTNALHPKKLIDD